jgi:hypothetical protein
MATPSRTTPARKTSTKPAAPKAKPVDEEPTFHFSIKQAEAEHDDEIAEEGLDPFTVEGMNGETIVFKDARTMGWQETSLVTLRDPHTAVRTILLDEYVDLFYSQGDFSIPTLTNLLKRWMAHYGVTPAGN